MARPLPNQSSAPTTPPLALGSANDKLHSLPLDRDVTHHPFPILFYAFLFLVECVLCIPQMRRDQRQCLGVLQSQAAQRGIVS